MIIDLMDWDCSYGEFYDWVRDCGATVTASIKLDTSYYFKNGTDILSFKLRFKRELVRTPRDFFDNGHPDANYF
jgi:hypothetical protein